MNLPKIETAIKFLKTRPEIPVLAFLGLALRLPLISNGIWADEAITLKTLTTNLIHNPWLLRVEIHPPLYFYLLKLWALLGTDLEWLRLSSVVLGVVSIVLCYELGVFVKDRQLGIVLAALTATSPLHIYYSHELRPYALILVLTPLLILFWLKTLRHSNPIKFIIISELCLLTHFTFIILIPIILLSIVVALARRKDYQILKRLLGYASILVVTAMAIALQKFNQGLFAQMTEQVPGSTDWSKMFIPLIKIKETVLTYFQFGNFYWLVPPTLVALTKKMILVASTLATLWLALKRREYSSVLQTLLPLAAVFALANLAISYAEFLSLYPYGGRHILPLLFFWLLIVALLWGLVLDKHRWFGGVLLLSFLAITGKYGPSFDHRQSFSNGYVEAVRFSIQQQFEAINFVNPDETALTYTRQQFGKHLTISKTDQVVPNVPSLVTLDFKKNLAANFETLYTNPQGTTFLIRLPATGPNEPTVIE